MIDIHDAQSRALVPEHVTVLAPYRQFIDHALAQTAAFEASDAAGTVARRADAIDTPQHGHVHLAARTAASDLSAGEQAELTSYLATVADATHAVNGADGPDGRRRRR